MRILLVTNYKYGVSDYRFMGSTRDILGREEYFKERGIEYDQIHSLYRDDGDLLGKLKQADVGSYNAILFEKSDYPLCMAWVRRQHPEVKIILRSHNAEFLHRIHYLISNFEKDIFKGLSQAFNPVLFDHILSYNRLCHDLCSAHLADALLSITLWEAENYWPKVTDPAKVWVAPFFLPSCDISAKDEMPAKENLCVCLMSPAHTSLLNNAGKNFIQLVNQLDNRFDEWRFAITGDHEKYGFQSTDRITVTGLLDNPMEIVEKARCIALVSDYGFGFKTKIMESISRKCRVIITHRLMEYLPKEIMPYCIPINQDNPLEFAQALSECMKPYPDGSPNETFRQMQFKALDEVLEMPLDRLRKKSSTLYGKELYDSWPLARRVIHEHIHYLHKAQAMVSKIMPYQLEEGIENDTIDPIMGNSSSSLQEEYLVLNEKYHALRNNLFLWKNYALQFKQELENQLMESKAPNDVEKYI